MAYDTQAPQDQGTVPDPLCMVQVGLVASGPDGDYNVSDEGEAFVLVAELLGSSRKIEYGGDPGVWLVQFTPAEWHELETNGWFSRENDEAVLEAEMP
jgi:hypothetical protein